MQHTIPGAQWLPPAGALVLAAAAALGQAASLAPLHLAFASLATVALLHIATDGLGYRKAFVTGWWSGVVAQLVIYHWLADTIVLFGRLPPTAGVFAHVIYSVAMGLHGGLLALLAAFLMRRWRLHAAEAWPLAYVAVYASVPQLFPLYLGVELYILPSPWRPNPPHILFVSALVAMGGALIGAFVLDCTRRGCRARLPPGRAAVWLGAFAALLAVSWPRTLPATPQTLRVAIAQTNFALGQRIDEHERRARLETLLAQYRLAVAHGARLVVFGESSLPFLYLVAGETVPPGRSYAWEMSDRINEAVLAAGVPMIANGIAYAGDRVANRSVFIEPTPEGRIRTQVYAKHRLLWFGEHVPLRESWPGHQTIFAGVVDHAAGPGPVLWTWNGLTLLPTICYEAILPWYSRLAMQGSGSVDLMVNLTNDKWFGLTVEHEQHLMLATWRSAETGVPMVRATQDGISAIVDGRGEILVRTALGAAGVWIADVPLNRAHAPPKE